ncbi:hypothetical protein Tco_1523053 [Tanacetum coccineum]
MLFDHASQQQTRLFVPSNSGYLISTLVTSPWGTQKKSIHVSNVVTNDMFQPWRALTTIINLCLTGKTSGFERPRAPVLQILWGVINRAHIDYAERMWEEFTQSIHTFTEDKKNLAQHTLGKKKATLILPPCHLPTEEPILGYLKFSAKGTKREVFGMPIPNELITDDIRGADYYNAYLKKVAKHHRYLAGEEVSDPDSPAPKPAKSTKPKITKQTKPVAPKAATKKPQPAPTKPKEKNLSQIRKPLKQHHQPNEQSWEWAIEESLKDAHGTHRGPLPPVVFRETDTGKYQPLPEVEGKGKEKVGAEQAARVLLNLQTLKKKKAQLTTTSFRNSKCAPDEGQAGPNPGIQDKDQARPNPGIQDEGHLDQNPDAKQATDATSQPQPGQ